MSETITPQPEEITPSAPRLTIRLVGGPLAGRFEPEDPRATRRVLNTHLHAVFCDKLPASGGHSRGNVRAISYTLGGHHVSEETGELFEYDFDE